MRRAPPQRGPATGFTLIELLAVILIIGILAAILLTQLGGADDSVKTSSARALLAELTSACDHYENEFGDYPPSSFRDDSGVDNAGTNVGVEALVVALWSKKYEAGGLLGDVKDALVNLDGDQSSQTLTDFGSRALLEISDPWGNPVAYLHRRDYEQKGRTYVTRDPGTDEELRSYPTARKNETTGAFCHSNSFQLFSAGADGSFGTPDDVANFDDKPR